MKAKKKAKTKPSNQIVKNVYVDRSSESGYIHLRIDNMPDMWAAISLDATGALRVARALLDAIEV